ncbi:hypothetical protein C0995_012704 [Termitomyces sp. Mi166|nr:hypothetical protein C0995_012704 [Termitomyces sp. Mi166\
MRELPPGVERISPIDISQEEAGAKIAVALGETKLDLVIVNAGIFKSPSVNRTSKIRCHSSEMHLRRSSSLLQVRVARSSYAPRKKVVATMATTEVKQAANMVGKLLASDFYDKGITVTVIHPGFMRTEVTRGVGYDKYWDSGGAVEPAVAARSTIDFISTLTHEQTGTFWAPRDPRDIGEAERVLGKNLPTPLELPW